MSTSKRRRSQTTPSPSCDVFISYRRDGGDMAALYFYRALKERGYRVFYDLDTLRSGSFDEALLRSIHSCKDFVLILSPHALDRCIDPNDWVRAEIAEALHMGKNIVPIMLKDFVFPDYLPEDIDAVRYQNGLTSMPEYFNECISRVCNRYLLSKPVNLKKKKKTPVLPILLIIAAILLFAVALLYLFMPQKTPSDTGLVPVPIISPELLADTPIPTDTPVYHETPAPSESPSQAILYTQVPEITPVPQVVYTEVPAEIIYYENAGGYNPYAAPSVQSDTPIPLYNPPAPPQNIPAVTAAPVYTEEPQPIITPIPLVTPVQQQDMTYPQDTAYTQNTAYPQDTTYIQDDSQSVPMETPQDLQADASVTPEPIQSAESVPATDIPTDTPVPTVPEAEIPPVS